MYIFNNVLNILHYYILISVIKSGVLLKCIDNIFSIAGLS